MDPDRPRAAPGRRPTHCVRCNRTLIVAQFRDRSACRTCTRDMCEAIDEFIPRARVALGGTSIDDAAWQRLLAALESQRIPLGYALTNVRIESRAHLERFIRTALGDGEVTDATIQEFERRVTLLEPPEVWATELRGRLAQGRRLTEIRRGNLPTVDVTDVVLDSDERCHIIAPCHYERPLQRRVTSVAGTILLTNKKFRFVGYGDGWELAWAKIVNVDADADRSIEIRATQKRGSGRYHLKDAEYVATVMMTLARIAKRQLVGRPDTIDTPVVPQHVKSEVFHRDGGRCRECGSSNYLEYDHIIPRSKGGATSVNNLQLLCRGCNLRKGNRI